MLVHDDVPRGRWQLAVIEELIEGLDGFSTRAAKIRTKTRRTNRPTARLYPLEVSSTSEGAATTDNVVLMYKSQGILPPAAQEYQELLLSRLMNTLRTGPIPFLWPRRMSRIN